MIFISHLAEQNLHVYIFKENMELLLLDLLIFPPQTLATFRHKTYIYSCISGSKVHKHREITKTNTTASPWTTFPFARPHTLITFHCFLFLARSDIFYKPRDCFFKHGNKLCLTKGTMQAARQKMADLKTEFWKSCFRTRHEPDELWLFQQINQWSAEFKLHRVELAQRARYLNRRVTKNKRAQNTSFATMHNLTMESQN